MTDIVSWYEIEFNILAVVIVGEGEGQLYKLLCFLSAGNFEYFGLLLTFEYYFSFQLVFPAYFVIYEDFQDCSVQVDAGGFYCYGDLELLVIGEIDFGGFEDD